MTLTVVLFTAPDTFFTAAALGLLVGTVVIAAGLGIESAGSRAEKNERNNIGFGIAAAGAGLLVISAMRMLHLL
ncbi:hypothetical protein ACWIGW_16425 [Nocardia brasiliensis]